MKPVLNSLQIAFSEAIEHLKTPVKGRFLFFLFVNIFISVCSAIVLFACYYGYDVFVSEYHRQEVIESFINAFKQHDSRILGLALILPFFFRTLVTKTNNYTVSAYTGSLDGRAYGLFFIGFTVLNFIWLSLERSDYGSAYSAYFSVMVDQFYYNPFILEIWRIVELSLSWLALGWLVNSYQSRSSGFGFIKLRWPSIVSAAIFYYAITGLAATLFESFNSLVVVHLGSLFVEPIIPTILVVIVAIVYNSLVLMILSVFVQSAFRSQGFEGSVSLSKHGEILDDTGEIRDYEGLKEEMDDNP